MKAPFPSRRTGSDIEGEADRQRLRAKLWRQTKPDGRWLRPPEGFDAWLETLEILVDSEGFGLEALEHLPVLATYLETRDTPEAFFAREVLPLLEPTAPKTPLMRPTEPDEPTTPDTHPARPLRRRCDDDEVTPTPEDELVWFNSRRAALGLSPWTLAQMCEALRGSAGGEPQ